MLELLLDPLAASLRHAAERVDAETAASGERTARLQALAAAVHGVGRGNLLAALHAEAQRVATLTEAVVHAKEQFATAQSEVLAVHDAARLLTHGLETLAQSEHAALVAAETFKTDLDGIDARAGEWAHALEETLTHAFDPLTTAAHDVAHLVEMLARDTHETVGTMHQHLASWMQAFDQNAQTLLQEGWEGLTGKLQGNLTDADAQAGDWFGHSGSSLGDGIVGAGEATFTHVANGADRVAEVLHKVNDAIDAAEKLEQALSIAAGGF